MGYHLNQANPLLHDIELEDSLWAFTRRRDGTYALAAELVVSARTTNPPRYRYGSYRVWGDLGRSRYFALDGQPDISALVRSLKASAGGDVLGRAFQGRAAVRRLGPEDGAVLAACARALLSEPRARLVPEEAVEALMSAGDEEAVARLLREEPSGLAAERRVYLARAAVRRDRELVLTLRDLYDGACQICGWTPRRSYGRDLCEAHHVRWLSRGGTDDLSNLALLCPNHHRAVHRCDAQFDFGTAAFVFPTGLEEFRMSLHDLAP